MEPRFQCDDAPEGADARWSPRVPGLCRRRRCRGADNSGDGRPYESALGASGIDPQHAIDATSTRHYNATQVAEAALVGVPGTTSRARRCTRLVTLTQDAEGQAGDELAKELVPNMLRALTSRPSSPDTFHWAPTGLPKTRSGKIMRRILRKIAAEGADVSGLGTRRRIADPGIVDELVPRSLPAGVGSLLCLVVRAWFGGFMLWSAPSRSSITVTGFEGFCRSFWAARAPSLLSISCEAFRDVRAPVPAGRMTDALFLTLASGLEHAATALDVVDDEARQQIASLLSPKARQLLAALTAADHPSPPPTAVKGCRPIAGRAALCIGPAADERPGRRAPDRRLDRGPRAASKRFRKM